MIFEECVRYLKTIPKEMHEKLERKLPNQIRSECKLCLFLPIFKHLENSFFDTCNN